MRQRWPRLHNRLFLSVKLSGMLLSPTRNSLHPISASFEFRNREDTSQPIDASVVWVSKLVTDADIGDVANFETTTLVRPSILRKDLL
jgi:hypothetical protein